MNESVSTLSCHPRYSDQPFPRYRFVPGETPHPRHHRHGHSFGQPEPVERTFEVGRWHESEAYKFGIDLFNFGYWWESHELFEALWQACGPQTPEGRFFQGLIQLAAAHLKRRMGNTSAASRLFRRACTTLQQAPPLCMGIDIATLLQAAERCSTTADRSAIVLRLNFSDEGMAGKGWATPDDRP